MKRLLLVPAIGLITAPALASPEVLPVAGIAGVWNYNLATGEKTPAGAERDLGPHIWGPTTPSGWFFSLGCNDIVLDWGDIETPARVGGFGFAYATNANHGIDCILAFYGDDNGWCQPNRDFIAAFYFTGLNGTLTPQDRNQYWSWIYRAEVNTPFVIDANDLDGDGLGDFSYTYWFDHDSLESPDPNPIVGPLIAGDPNTDGEDCPGVEDAFDIFNEPNYSPAPGSIDPNLTHYTGTYWFGGFIFSQFYMELFAPDCPNRGDSGRYCQADIDGSFDCIVGLADLAQLLGCYGCDQDDPSSPCYPDCTRLEGDIDPYDPWFCCHGTIDLGDLAEMLYQYGDNCNWPQP